MASSAHSIIDNNQGFTIIEVMIVLVIAAVILLIVFIAVPQLQRNARNYQRKRIASGILADLMESAANTGNPYPKDGQASELCSLLKNNTIEYVGDISSCSGGFVGGEPDRDCIMAQASRGYSVCLQSQANGSHYYRGPYDEMTIQIGHWCTDPKKPLDPNDIGNNAIVTSQHNKPPDFRIISVRTMLENNIDFCVDNGLVVL